MPGRKRLVLVVEGNERAGRETQHRLEGELGGDVRIVAALGADEALAVVQAWPPHVAVIRVDAWEGGAARLCEAMRQCGRRMGVLALRGGELAAVADVKRALREACPQETWMRALGREADPHGRHPFAVAFRLLCLPDKTTARMEGVSVAAIKAFRARIGGVPMQGRSWSERLAWVVARLEARRASGNSAGGGDFLPGPVPAPAPAARTSPHRADARRLAQDVPAQGERAARGLVRLEKRRCGKCASCRAGGEGHGPYRYEVTWRAGHVVRRYLGAA